MSTTVMGRREWLLLIALSLLWGAAFPLTEVALTAFPPLTVVLARVGLAAATLAAVVCWRGAGLPAEPRLWLAFLIMGALNNALPFTLIVSGQTEITSGLAAILNSTTPLWSVLLAHVLSDGERITGHRLLGLGLGIAGVAVLVGPSALADLGQGLGQLAVLAAALSYACAAIFGRRFRGRPPMVVATGQLTCATLLLLPLALLVDRPWTLAADGAASAALLALALPCTALAYLLYFRILAAAGPTNLMLVTLLIPVSALWLGVLLLGERPGPMTLAGMALILCGLIAIDGRAPRALLRRARLA